MSQAAAPAAMTTALIIGILFLVPTAAASTSATWFPHATGECADGGITYGFDTADSPDDLDGCGGVGTAASQGGFSVTYPSKVGLGASVVNGSAAEAHVWISTFETGDVSVDIAVRAGKASCAASSATQQIVSTPLTASASYVEFVVPCEFTGTAEAEDKPALELVIHSTATYFMGYEGDHTTHVVLNGLATGTLVAPVNGTGEPDGEPAQGVPSPAILPILAAAIALGLARRR
jgi:hypothetical protein